MATPRPDVSPTVEHVFFDGPAGALHAVCAGPANGPVVLLLHGFPEFWYGWRKQIGPLAAAGFRVIVLDQRGYGESAKPTRICAYSLSELRRDILAVIRQLGRDRICLAGHDWGGIVSWSFAMHHPELLHSLAILNAPHPAAARRFLTRKPRQLLRSWYIFFFQLPVLPELLFSAIGSRALSTTTRPGTFTAEDLDLYRAAWARPIQGGVALRTMIHWYRALLRCAPLAESAPVRVPIPVRILWGALDEFLVPALADASLIYCDQGEVISFPRASHWVQHEEPEAVSQALIDLFRRPSGQKEKGGQ